MNDVLLSPLRLSELENLIEKSVLRALSKAAPVPPQPADVAPVMSSKQVQEMTGWPNGTFYAKVAEMPEGVVIRKSKRLLFDREKLMVWLKTPARP